MGVDGRRRTSADKLLFALLLSAQDDTWVRKNRDFSRFFELVPRAGLEPARPFGLGILSPLCLPFHHRGIAFLLGF